MLAGDVLVTDPLTSFTERTSGPDDVAALIRATDDGYVLVGRRSVYTGSPSHWESSLRMPLDATIRCNDGGISVDGELFVGTMDVSEQVGAGAVWSIRHQTFRPALASTTVSNGMAFLPDGTCWFIDSPTKSVRRFAVSENQLRPTGEVITTSAHPGVPDGLCADAEGGLWVAMWDGGCVVRITPEGMTTHIVPLPVRRPTSVCFGGRGGDQLFITTSAYGGVDQHPAAGSLFMASPRGHVGVPTFTYTPNGKR